MTPPVAGAATKGLLSPTFKAAQQTLTEAKYSAGKAQERFQTALDELGSFEKSSAWTGAGEKADFTKHDALRADLQLARAELFKANRTLETSEGSFNNQQRLNTDPNLGQKLDYAA